MEITKDNYAVMESKIISDIETVFFILKLG